MAKPAEGELKPTISSFVWHVNFCGGCKTVGEFVDSPVFSVNYLNKETKWRMQMYPKGSKEEKKDFIELYICNMNENNEVTTASITLSLLNAQNRKVAEHSMIDKAFHDPSSSWGYDTFISRREVFDESSALLIDDKLKILCEIVFDPVLGKVKQNNIGDRMDVDDFEDHEDHEQIEQLLGRLSQRLSEFDDFEKLLESNKFSDVTLIVGEKKFQAHKAIITARSPVFDAMFHHEMKEKEQNIIEINDIKPEVLQELLRFVYAGKVNNIDQMVTDLLIAADKYSIEGLRALCEKTLFDNLNAENVLNCLKLAATCNTVKLKSQVIEFIIAHAKEIVDKPEFKMIGSLHPEVMCEVVCALVEQKK